VCYLHINILSPIIAIIYFLRFPYCLPSMHTFQKITRHCIARSLRLIGKYISFFGISWLIGWNYSVLYRQWLLTQLGTRLVVLVVCVVTLELMIMMTYTPSHNVVEKVVSPVCRCDRCGQCLVYSITFPESLCDSYWDVKPCKEQFCCYFMSSYICRY